MNNSKNTSTQWAKTHPHNQNAGKQEDSHMALVVKFTQQLQVTTAAIKVSKNGDFVLSWHPVQGWLAAHQLNCYVRLIILVVFRFHYLPIRARTQQLHNGITTVVEGLTPINRGTHRNLVMSCFILHRRHLFLCCISLCRRSTSTRRTIRKVLLRITKNMSNNRASRYWTSVRARQALAPEPPRATRTQPKFTRKVSRTPFHFGFFWTHAGTPKSCPNLLKKNQKKGVLETFRVNSGWLRAAHGGCGAKAPPLAARPDYLAYFQHDALFLSRGGLRRRDASAHHW